MKTLEVRREPIDELVAEVTAFNSWPELRARLEMGYVPTLYGSAAKDRLADWLECRGYRVFRGTN